MDQHDTPPIKRTQHLRVPVQPAEAQAIQALAKAAGLPVAAYLRHVGLGVSLRGKLDHKMVEELARINGDLCHMKQLLQLWLADEVRTKAFGDLTLRAVLTRIDATQRQMQQIMRSVVLPRSRP